MSLLKHVERHLARQQGGKLNAFVTLADPAACCTAALCADERAKLGKPFSKLDGRLVAVKDNICTADLPTTSASNILKGYVSPFEATVVKKLQAGGCIIGGKTNLDEFGMGSHSTHSATGAVVNPIVSSDWDHSAGGSSGGSAAAVATDQCFAALGTDTGGSVRLPAAYCGVVGFKPSYGLLSRYGVVAYANSLDTVGILGSSVGTVRDVFQIVNGHDLHDPTSLSDVTRSTIRKAIFEYRTEKRSTTNQKLRLGVPVEYNIHELEDSVRSSWRDTLQRLQDAGHEVLLVSLPATKLALAAYYILAPAEASSNLARYDGVRFGNRSPGPRSIGDVLFARTRGEGFNAEVRRRILLGSYTLSSTAIDNYFIQAQKLRRLVQRDFNNVFGLEHPLLEPQQRVDLHPAIDLLLTPTAPTKSPTLRDVANRPPIEGYRDDVFTVPASLAGLPSISIPVISDVEKGLPTGMQLIGQYGDDDMVLEAAVALEKAIQD